MKKLIELKIKQALKDKDKKLLLVLRDMKSKLDEAEKQKKKELTSKDNIDVLSKMAKNRKQSIDAYEKAERQDLVDKETYELNVIAEYLPKKMTEEEIEMTVVNIIEKHSYSTMKDMGKVMGEFNKNYIGQDGSIVSSIVKKRLIN